MKPVVDDNEFDDLKGEEIFMIETPKRKKRKHTGLEGDKHTNFQCSSVGLYM